MPSPLPPVWPGLPLQGVAFATLSTADPQCSDLLKDTEPIEQTVFFGNLALNDPVKGRAHAGDGLPGRGDPKKEPIDIRNQGR